MPFFDTINRALKLTFWTVWGGLCIGKNSVLGEYGIYNVFSNVKIGDNVITADRVSFVSNIHTYENINIPVKD